jgi:hypothetical protein
MEIGRILVFAGLALALAGGIVWLAARMGLGRMPGDIVVERDNVTIAIPIITSIVLSIVLTIVLNVVLRLR